VVAGGGVVGAADADVAAEADAAAVGFALCVEPDALVGVVPEVLPTALAPLELTPTEPVAPAFWAEAADTNTIDASTANAALRSLITEPSRQ
jgi:hypothetical protein